MHGLLCYALCAAERHSVGVLVNSALTPLRTAPTEIGVVTNDCMPFPLGDFSTNVEVQPKAFPCTKIDLPDQVQPTQASIR